MSLHPSTQLTEHKLPTGRTIRPGSVVTVERFGATHEVLRKVTVSSVRRNPKGGVEVHIYHRGWRCFRAGEVVTVHNARSER